MPASLSVLRPKSYENVYQPKNVIASLLAEHVCNELAASGDMAIVRM